jgi:trigger factor
VRRSFAALDSRGRLSACRRGRFPLVCALSAFAGVGAPHELARLLKSQNRREKCLLGFDGALLLSLHSRLYARGRGAVRIGHRHLHRRLTHRKANVSPTDTSSSTKREIQVEIPAADVARETETLIQKYQKLARIPGFRTGHAPASIIKQRFAEGIKSDVVDALVPRYFRKETDKLGLMPVSQPRVSDLHVHDGEPLTFKASFEVLPTIRVEDYKELRADKPDTSVTDEEVEQSLKSLQEQRATFTAIEGSPLGDGDFAQVSLDGKPKDAEGGSASPATHDSTKPASTKPGPTGSNPVHMDDILVEIGGQGTMPEFTENLRGASAGDERTFDVHYPQDFSDQRLAGKTFIYTVKVKAIKQKTLPEVNDQFAKELGEFADLGALRKRIREDMEAEKKHTAEREAKDKLVAELVKRNDFEVPEALVENQIDLRLERGLRALAARGMKSEEMKKMDLHRLRGGQREQAVQEVKAALLLEKIAEEEKIEVSDAEIDREVEALAEQSKQSMEIIRSRLTREGALDRIRNRIRNEKTLDFLYHQSA